MARSSLDCQTKHLFRQPGWRKPLHPYFANTDGKICTYNMCFPKKAIYFASAKGETVALEKPPISSVRMAKYVFRQYR